MSPVVIRLPWVREYAHFEIRLADKKSELWVLPGLEDDAIIDAIVEMAK